MQRINKNKMKRQHKKTYWNEGWIEEVECKLHERKVEIINEERKADIKLKIN